MGSNPICDTMCVVLVRRRIPCVAVVVIVVLLFVAALKSEMEMTDVYASVLL